MWLLDFRQCEHTTDAQGYHRIDGIGLVRKGFKLEVRSSHVSAEK
jgi:hypothetical protein